MWARRCSSRRYGAGCDVSPVRSFRTPWPRLCPRTSSERRGRRKSLLPSGCPLERRSKVHHDLFPLFPHTSSPITPLLRGPPETCRRSSRGRDVRGRPRRVLRAERLLLYRYPPHDALTSRGDNLLFNVPGLGSQFHNHRLQLRPGRVRRSPVAYSRKLGGE